MRRWRWRRSEELIAHGVPIGDRAVVEGLARVVWPARLEIMARRPLVLLDCAHNVASVRALVQALDSSFPVRGRRILIFGGNRDKDLAGMLAVLTPRFDRVYLTSFHGSARCVPAEELAAMAPAESFCCVEPVQAWQRARAEAAPGDMICVTGSVFLAGELRPTIMAES